MKVLICGPKASNISGISDAISLRYIRKNPHSMYARVPHGTAISARIHAHVGGSRVDVVTFREKMV